MHRGKILEQRSQTSYVCTMLAVSLSLGALTSSYAYGQNVQPPLPPPSRVTPETGVPNQFQNNEAILLPETQSTHAPAVSENLTIVVGDISVDGAEPRFAQLIEERRSALKGRTVTIAELYQTAAVIEAAYAKAGYILTRATVPPQTVSNGSVFRIVIVEGFIESVDVDGVPQRVRSAVRSRIASLVGTKGLRLVEIERRLVIANDIPGISLASTLVPGLSVGATKLVIEGDWQPITMTLTADNRPSRDYDGASYSVQVSLNATLGLGELIYAQATTAPDIALSATSPLRRIFALGAIFPLGSSGLTFNPEYIRSDTNPISGEGVLRVQGAFEKISLRAAYPILRTRRQSLTINAAFELVSERQTARDFDIDLSEDHLRYLSAGLVWARSLGTNTNFTLDGMLTQGLSGLGTRTLDDAISSGVPLSRQGSQPDFTKANLRMRVDQRLTRVLALATIMRGQTSFSGALPSSAQFSLDGEEAISGFDLGALNVDSGITARSEISASLPYPKEKVLGHITPYVFAALGYGQLKEPTFFELSEIKSSSIGGGVRFALAVPRTNSTLFGGVELAAAQSDNRPENNRLNVTLALRF